MNLLKPYDISFAQGPKVMYYHVMAAYNNSPDSH
ncbi:MAG: hypothetical protein OSP8Acid_09440 [uncultured Acidilobus sp. OSP8]|nr:MAG: hypothetical protein OSP8Acid_09440 [uncultured Acidilobus sp. OSP8]